MLTYFSGSIKVQREKVHLMNTVNFAMLIIEK